MATIQKRNNAYLIRVSAGYDINDKQIIKSMTWKPEPGMTQRQIEKELQRQAVLFEDKCKSGQFLDGSIKFAEFTEKWMKDYAENQLKAKTIARYKDLLKRINMAIGHIKLDKLQPVHLIRFYDNLAENGIRSDIKYKSTVDLSKLLKGCSCTKTAFCDKADISIATLNNACKGYNISLESANKISLALGLKLENVFEQCESEKLRLSDKTIQHYHRLISSILQTAVQWQVIFSNPCDRVKPPKVERKESRYLEDTEVKELLTALECEPILYKAIITLITYTGMRRGEICGLKWKDIDFKNQMINVQREVLYLPQKGIFEDSTKTYSSQRFIKTSDVALSILKSYKSEQNANRLKCGDCWHDDDFVFTQWNGRPMHPDSVTGWFRKFIEKNNLPQISIHSLRHTNASLMIANGVNLTTVSKRLGHATTATTTKIYAHAIKSADEAANETIENILNIKNK
ncbi:MAG: tyrosine recombinase XerC [Anaerotignaceae bacterium]